LQGRFETSDDAHLFCGARTAKCPNDGFPDFNALLAGLIFMEQVIGEEAKNVRRGAGRFDGMSTCRRSTE
jgi:hypothetical protein